MSLCECGCGQITKQGNRFIHGHQGRGENNPAKRPEIRKKISENRIGKLKGENNPMKRPGAANKFIKNEIGNIYGRLTVIEEAGRSKAGAVLWKCVCDCGNEVIVSGNSLRFGTKSCGCFQREQASMIGENNPAWKGGVSKQSYCYLFNETLKEAHRRYFGYKCFIDNEPEENGRKLSDHHVGYDKRCGCDATQFCIFVPVKTKWNTKFNGSKKYNRWYWYSFLMNKIFIEHPNYFVYHIPVWGMDTLEYNYNYVFEKFRRRGIK